MTNNKSNIQRKLVTQLEEIHLMRYDKLLIEMTQLQNEQDKNKQEMKGMVNELTMLNQQERQYYNHVYYNDFCNKISSVERRKIYSKFDNFVTQKNNLEMYIAELNEQISLLAKQIADKQAQIRNLVIKKEKFIELRKFI